MKIQEKKKNNDISPVGVDNPEMNIDQALSTFDFKELNGNKESSNISIREDKKEDEENDTENKKDGSSKGSRVFLSDQFIKSIKDEAYRIKKQGSDSDSEKLQKIISLKGKKISSFLTYKLSESKKNLNETTSLLNKKLFKLKLLKNDKEYKKESKNIQKYISERKNLFKSQYARDYFTDIEDLLGSKDVKKGSTISRINRLLVTARSEEISDIKREEQEVMNLLPTIKQVEKSIVDKRNVNMIGVEDSLIDKKNREISIVNKLLENQVNGKLNLYLSLQNGKKALGLIEDEELKKITKELVKKEETRREGREYSTKSLSPLIRVISNKLDIEDSRVKKTLNLKNEELLDLRDLASNIQDDELKKGEGNVNSVVLKDLSTLTENKINTIEDLENLENSLKSKKIKTLLKKKRSDLLRQREEDLFKNYVSQNLTRFQSQDFEIEEDRTSSIEAEKYKTEQEELKKRHQKEIKEVEEKELKRILNLDEDKLLEALQDSDSLGSHRKQVIVDELLDNNLNKEEIQGLFGKTTRTEYFSAQEIDNLIENKSSFKDKLLQKKKKIGKLIDDTFLLQEKYKNDESIEGKSIYEKAIKEEKNYKAQVKKIDKKMSLVNDPSSIEEEIKSGISKNRYFKDKKGNLLEDISFKTQEQKDLIKDKFLIKNSGLADEDREYLSLIKKQDKEKLSGEELSKLSDLEKRREKKYEELRNKGLSLSKEDYFKARRSLFSEEDIKDSEGKSTLEGLSEILQAENIKDESELGKFIVNSEELKNFSLDSKMEKNQANDSNEDDEEDKEEKDNKEVFKAIKDGDFFKLKEKASSSFKDTMSSIGSDFDNVRTPVSSFFTNVSISITGPLNKLVKRVEKLIDFLVLEFYKNSDRVFGVILSIVFLGVLFLSLSLGGDGVITGQTSNLFTPFNIDIIDTFNTSSFPTFFFFMYNLLIGTLVLTFGSLILVLITLLMFFGLKSLDSIEGEKVNSDNIQSNLLFFIFSIIGLIVFFKVLI